MAVISDPIADMLTRVRNAILAGHAHVTIPASNIKLSIADILQKEGFINAFERIEGDVQDQIKIALKYVGRGDSAIKGLQRVSRPGRRVYSGSKKLQRVRNGLGIAILSTSQGLMTDKDARHHKVGGEVLCNIW